MVDATQILGELLGGGNRGSGNLNSRSGAKALEDLLGVGKGSGGGGGVFGGSDQRTGGGVSGDRSQSGGGIFGGEKTSQQAPSGGGLGDLLGKALKELTQPRAPAGGGNSMGAGSNNPFDPPAASSTPSAEHMQVYLRAMIQAGLADGRLDEKEQQAVLAKVGTVGRQEADFIRAEMARGCDVEAFIHTVPRGIEEQVYTMALMAIDLDNRTEAQFLDALARGLRVTQEQSNAIHDRLGAQRLYR